VKIRDPQVGRIQHPSHHCRRHDIENLGGVFADLGELGAAAARARGPRRLDNAPTRRCSGNPEACVLQKQSQTRTRTLKDGAHDGAPMLIERLWNVTPSSTQNLIVCTVNLGPEAVGLFLPAIDATAKKSYRRMSEELHHTPTCKRRLGMKFAAVEIYRLKEDDASVEKLIELIAWKLKLST
jgi:hypothetical protein